MDKKQESANGTDLETLAFFSSSIDSRTRCGRDQTDCDPVRREKRRSAKSGTGESADPTESAAEPNGKEQAGGR